MGSCSWTSRKVRPMPAAPPCCSRAPSRLLSLAPSTRSCSSSFSDRERPVPSYLRQPHSFSHHFIPYGTHTYTSDIFLSRFITKSIWTCLSLVQFSCNECPLGAQTALQEALGGSRVALGFVHCPSRKRAMLHSTARIDCSKEGREGAPVDCGAEEDKVGPQHGLDQGQRDGGGLIDDQQLRLPQPLVVLRLNVLHRLYSRAQNVAQHKLTDIISLFIPLSSNALPPVQARCYRINSISHACSNPGRGLLCCWNITQGCGTEHYPARLTWGVSIFCTSELTLRDNHEG